MIQKLSIGRPLALFAVLVLAGCGPANRKEPANTAGPVITETLRARSVVPDPGAKVCEECHPVEYDLWLDSQHANANRLLDMTLDAPAFEPPHTVKEGSFVTEISKTGERLAIRQSGPAGSSVHEPEAVIGVTPLVQYLVPFPGGRLQVVDISYDPRSNEWFNVYGSEDRQPHEWGFWKNRSMTWNVQCAFCHMTKLEKGYNPETDSYQTTWSAMGITCAQCHTGLDDHVVSEQERKARGETNVIDYGTSLTPDRVMDNCATCHSRREEITGTFKAGDAFHDHFRLALASQPHLYHQDGQVIDEDYVYGSLLMSRMAHKGITCRDCHEPHGHKLVVPVDHNILCLTCHGAPGQREATVIDPVAHGHHVAGSTGNACIDCHMPLNTYMARDPRRDHGFTSPDPLLTKELGIPNACDRCHVDKDTEWSLEWVEKWYGDRMDRRARTRARAIARAQRAEGDVPPELLSLIDSEEIPFWRATLVDLTQPWAATPRVRDILVQNLTNESALVRSAAVRSLRGVEGSYNHLKPLRQDASRLVRIDAAWATLNPLEHEDPSYQEVKDYLEFICDQPGGAARRAEFDFTEGRPGKAEEWARKVADWDPNAYTYQFLGRMLNMNGKHDEALTWMSAAVESDPEDAANRLSLALLAAEMGRLDTALEALKEAVRLDPGFGRAWYNLGLAYAQQEQLDEAVDALQRAEQLMPNEPDAIYARATIHLRQGDVPRAAEAAVDTLRLSPGHQGARSLLLQLQSPPAPTGP